MLALARRAIAAVRGNPGWALAILGLAVHLWASRGYDYFRDEMYFIVCGERLDWGFVDQPPLISGVPATVSYQGGRALTLAPNLTVSDADGATLSGARIGFDGGWTPSQGDEPER